MGYTPSPIISNMHNAWAQVTVLEDKSYANFHRIVMSCCDEVRSKLVAGKEKSYCSTGSVYVVGKKVDFDEENPYRYEIMITSTFCIKGC